VARFYRLVRLVIELLVLRGRRDRSKDAEILVLRHQLSVLRRTVQFVPLVPPAGHAIRRKTHWPSMRNRDELERRLRGALELHDWGG
jgi:hypothetical protein